MKGWEAGLIASGLSLILEALGRNNPLLGLYGALTHLLGTPGAFNLLHRLLGYGEAAKALAFLAALGLFLLLHRLLWGWPYLLLALYLALAGPWGLLAGLWLFLPRGWSGERRQVLGLGLLALAALLLGRRREGARKASASLLLGQGSLYQVSKNPPFLDPDLRGRPYRLEVAGLVDRPLVLSLQDLMALPARELVHTLICISNPVGGDLVGCLRWKGVSLPALLERAGPKREARYLRFEAADGCVESLPLAELPEDALLAYAAFDPERGGYEPLWPSHGYPVRLLLPGRYGMKQPKWLTRIRLEAEKTLGYWAERGWSEEARVRPMSRIDWPPPGASLRVGEALEVRGIAFAGEKPVLAVEVSVDGGKGWERAELLPAPGPYAWRLWRYLWRPEAPGRQALLVRAWTREGPQDPTPRDPLPDGATGLHRVEVVVR
ncbi:molybdopterin-binding oxidoreductase [Thermus scotoductus]|uniref:Molybdopterin-binding oxidoreductase n=1 Tax=Thermus scotoductus TaxID=37636 RepID=A0A430SFW3_THESC|nr:molybdopterin-dependent oxidoreductase [Thermus scotoductus]RTH38282.1 molybdopterin-binding oxidoreductase [Thermus scotoductus]